MDMDPLYVEMRNYEGTDFFKSFPLKFEMIDSGVL